MTGTTDLHTVFDDFDRGTNGNYPFCVQDMRRRVGDTHSIPGEEEKAVVFGFQGKGLISFCVILVTV